MPEELTSRKIIFICLLMGRSCTYLDVKTDIELYKKFHSTIPVVHSTIYTLPSQTLVQEYTTV